MEAKLAEFRKKQAEKKPLINRYNISSRFFSIFSFLSKKSPEIKVEEQKEDEIGESINNWRIILIKFFLWLTLFVIFIRLEFGVIYFIISLLYLMWYSLDSRRRRNELSAYSVFNPNFEKIQGTFSAEDYDRQLRHDMLSTVKRLCTSPSTSLIKYQWKPVLDDDYLHLPNFQSMIVACVKDRRLTSDILLLLNEIYPWPNSLKHVRRLYQNNNQLDIILYPEEFSKPINQEQFEKYFENQTKITNIPEKPCLLKWQYDLCIKQYWPNIAFSENKILEQTQLNKDLTEFDQIILDLFKKIKENDNDEYHYSIIVDDKNEIPLVGCRDYRNEHPLQHSTIVAIDLLSSNSIYLRDNLIEKFVEKKQTKTNYLLNGCSIYLTDEPCIMCSMALLHSRISNVYYLKSNSIYGSLGSIYKLHTLKKTNHRFNVYHLKQID